MMTPSILAIHNVCVELRGNPQGHTYKDKPNSLLSDQYPNKVVIPAIHITTTQGNTIVQFLLVNLSTDIIFLSKNKILGLLDKSDSEIYEIPTSSASETLTLEVTSKQSENVPQSEEGKFICSPADITIH